MNHSSLNQLVQNGDAEGVKVLLKTQKDLPRVEWAMSLCIEHNQRHILDLLMEHASTHLTSSPSVFAGPLACAAGSDEDAVFFEHVLKYAPSHSRSLSSALNRLLEQEKNGSNPDVMKKFELWCEKADSVSLEEALSCVAVCNLPRFLHYIYPKWIEGASEQTISSKLFESLTNCFSWREGQHGVTLRHPQIYDFWLAQVSPSLAQHFLDQIAYEKNLDHFQYMPWTPMIYEVLEPVLQNIVQNEVLKNSVQECATTPSVVRKM